MFEIVGYEKIEFTNQDTGELVDGYKLHLLGEEFDSNNRFGRPVLTKFFSSKYIKGSPIKVGAFCEFIVTFDSSGKPKLRGINII